VEYISNENIMIVLLAMLSGLNLFLNYFSKSKAEMVEVEYPEQIRKTC
jgi:hypothetical protein